MTKHEYQVLRRYYRNNGRSYVRRHAAYFNTTPADIKRLFDALDAIDRLAVRQYIIDWCAKEGRCCNPRLTA